MSSLNYTEYSQKCIGLISCPFEFDVVFGAVCTTIPIYVLEEDLSEDEYGFKAKKGDLLLGGGKSEIAAIRIALPEAFDYYCNKDWLNRYCLADIVDSCWSINESFILCTGFYKLGWSPCSIFEVWITLHVITFVVKNYYDDYKEYIGDCQLNKDYDGSICRLPSKVEAERW